jgi:nicotinate-nucleotide adenylyltransferase
MKQVGLFFGSFNPIHVGHLILANHFAEHTALEEVWLVVTPQNPFKVKQSMLDNRQRLELVYRACEPYPKLKPSDIEFDLPTPNYTIDTLVRLKEKYPSHQFTLLVGQDNLFHFHKWKNHDIILEDYGLLVYPRKSAESIPEALKNHPKIVLVAAPEINISSSSIRTQIKNGQNIRPLMPPESWQYLDEMNFYK